jgi:hypothetical protein
VVRIALKWVMSQEQAKSSGGVAVFSLWTDEINDKNSRIVLERL